MRKTSRAQIIGGATLVMVPGAAWASTIASIYTNGTAGNPYTVTGTITSILNTSATADTFTIADNTGSTLAYQIPTGTYTPTLGQSITVTAPDTEYDGGQEFDSFSSAPTINSPGGSVSPTVLTVPQLNATGNGASAVPPYAEAYLEIMDVTLPGGTTSLATGTSYTLTSGANTTILYTSAGYSNVVAAVTNANNAETASGNTLFAGPVNIIGYSDVYDGTENLYPLSITAVPEPASIGLLALGGIALMHRRGRSPDIGS
jgi:hypothetical protein